MKALTIRQPWAELIMQGRKTLELRTFTTKHRGPLAIHTSQKHPGAQVAARFGLDADALDYGCVIGTVEVVGVRQLDEAEYHDLADVHLGPRDFPTPVFGWELANPQRLAECVPYTGRMSVFEIPDTLLRPVQSDPVKTRPEATATSGRYDPVRPFELEYRARPSGALSLSMMQWPLKPAEQNGKPPVLSKVASIEGDTVLLIQDSINQTLRKSGYGPSILSDFGASPVALLEEPGLRLALLFLAVAPLTRVDRIDAVAQAIRAMPHEEAYYWYSKCTTPETAVRAQRALRVMLAEE